MCGAIDIIIGPASGGSKHAGHFHTAGSSGRKKLERELTYPPIMRAIASTDYDDYVGQELMSRNGADWAATVEVAYLALIIRRKIVSHSMKSLTASDQEYVNVLSTQTSEDQRCVQCD